MRNYPNQQHSSTYYRDVKKNNESFERVKRILKTQYDDMSLIQFDTTVSSLLFTLIQTPRPDVAEQLKAEGWSYHADELDSTIVTYQKPRHSTLFSMDRIFSVIHYLCILAFIVLLWWYVYTYPCEDEARYFACLLTRHK